MTDTDLEDFLSKWRGRWPEWRIAQVFVPEPQRARADAWCALLQEWTEAAWAGDDATPGAAKLVWWQEELRGWSKGLRRHPLGRVLQKEATSWLAVASALDGCMAVREGVRQWRAPDALLPALQPLAQALAEVEQALFGGDVAGDAQALLALHALWHREDAGTAAAARAWAAALADLRGARAGTRPRRIHDALVHARLTRVARGGEVAALPPLTALWRSWRAA